MQCPSCGFENMPGNVGCARCGSSLIAGTLTLDVNPPRNVGMEGRLRRLRATKYRFINLARTLKEIQDFWLTRAENQRDEGGSEWPLMTRLIVPGWSQRHLGEWWQGHAFFWTFLVLLLAGLFGWGTIPGAWLIWIAFFIHQYSTIDVFRQSMPGCDFSTRVWRTCFGMAAVGLCLWLPAGMVLLRVADPYTLSGAMGPLQAGDVVLVNHWLTPRTGRAILMNVPEYQIPLAGGFLFGNERERGGYVLRGPDIDRVLAVAGDDVKWDHGTLFVNGVASELRPMNPDALPPQISFHVGNGQVLAIPSTIVVPQNLLRQISWPEISHYSPNQITGVVYFRWRPFWRMSPID